MTAPEPSSATSGHERSRSDREPVAGAERVPPEREGAAREDAARAAPIEAVGERRPQRGVQRTARREPDDGPRSRPDQRRVAGVLAAAQPVGPGFGPYRWAPSVAEVAARHGLRPEHVLKFDQNTPPLPAVPRVPLGLSFASLHEYPSGGYAALRDAAAAYTGLAAENVVVGAGADDLILLVAHTFLGAGSRAAMPTPTYAYFRIVTELRGAVAVGEDESADVVWCCNPDNPTGLVVEPETLVERARAEPGTVVVVDEAYVEFGARSVAPWVDELPNLIVLRTMSKAFGMASLRVGFALAHADTAALLIDRRAPAPVGGPAARIAEAALRNPRLGDVEQAVAERERVRRALRAAGYECPDGRGNFVWIPTAEPLAERLEAEGIVVRGFPQGIRATLRRPSENDLLLTALGAEPGPPSGREATVLRTTSETALRVTVGLDGSGRARVDTGIGFLDHLLTLMAFHGSLDLELLAGGDLDVDVHHTVEDVLSGLGAALDGALGERLGVARYGAAVVPMDEASATAAVDLVRRAHAQIDLGLRGDRIGALPASLLGHALERFTHEAACTVHVTASGADDHHVAEAAFKALGRALRDAVAVSGTDPRSTKGAL